MVVTWGKFVTEQWISWAYGFLLQYPQGAPGEESQGKEPSKCVCAYVFPQGAPPKFDDDHLIFLQLRDGW